MKVRKYSDEEILRMKKEVAKARAEGSSAGEAVKKLPISAFTYYSRLGKMNRKKVKKIQRPIRQVDLSKMVHVTPDYSEAGELLQMAISLLLRAQKIMVAQ